MGVPSEKNDWSIKTEDKKIGEKIAHNYKRQVAEKMTREHLEQEDLDLKSMLSGSSKMKSPTASMTGSVFSN